MRAMFSLCAWIWLALAVGQAPAGNVSEATPLEGEGVHGFLRRHHLNPGDHLAQFKSLNAGKFGNDGGLLAHHSYLLPSVELTVVEPLFGERLKEVSIEGKVLRGATLFLVSGHGGPDPGAIGHYSSNDLYEDEYAYDITLRLARVLMAQGATVNMIIQDADDGIRDGSLLKPDKDERCGGLPIPLRQIERLKQRSMEVNRLSRTDKNSYQRCVVIHLDSRSRKEQLDVFFYHHHKSKNGKNMARTLRDQMKKNYLRHQPRRGFSGTVTSRNLYMLRKTLPPAVFVELGNIRNFRDQQRFVLENNRQALANWMGQGIIRDYQNYLNTLK